MSKKLTNKQKCRNCIHKTVCKYFGAYDDMEQFGYRCNHYFSKERAYKKRDTNNQQREGEWVAKDNFDGRCSIATCSNCGTEKAFSICVRTETIATLYPYCQTCGAKMKGGAE